MAADVLVLTVTFSLSLTPSPPFPSVADVRVRHGRVGVRLEAGGGGAFVNSNTFVHGVVSGGG